MRKGEIACNKQFLLFSQCFLPYMAVIFHFKCALKLSSAICFNLDQSELLSSGNGLTLSQLTKYKFKLMAFADHKFNGVIKLMVFFFESVKTLIKKILVTSIFSFSCNVS